MLIEDIEKRFLAEISQPEYRNGYIDENKEREILQVAILQGVSKDSAHAALVQVCQIRNCILESTVLHDIKEHLESVMGVKGSVSRTDFDRIVRTARQKMNGKRGDVQIKRMIVEVMEDSGLNKVRRGWFSNWYASLKRELGM
jgi:hypothetical protein